MTFMEADDGARRALRRRLRDKLRALDDASAKLVEAPSGLPLSLAHIVAMYLRDVLCNLGVYPARTVGAGRVPLPEELIPRAERAKRFLTIPYPADVFSCRRSVGLQRAVRLVGHSRVTPTGWQTEWIVVADPDGSSPVVAPPAWNWPWPATSTQLWYSRHVDEDTTLVLCRERSWGPRIDCRLFCWRTQTWKWNSTVVSSTESAGAPGVVVAPAHIFLLHSPSAGVWCLDRGTGRVCASTTFPFECVSDFSTAFADDRIPCVYLWKQLGHDGQVLAYRPLDESVSSATM